MDDAARFVPDGDADAMVPLEALSVGDVGDVDDLDEEEEENEENEQSTSSLQSFVVMFLQRRHFCVLFLLLPLLLPREKAAEK